MTHFQYPTSLHRRTQSPPENRRYQFYKPFLRVEFNRRCVYCRMPDGPSKPETFGVDHYRPKSKFPELSSIYGNLYYACSACNRWKGSFWPTEQQRVNGYFIVTPCEHVMSEHLTYNGVNAESRSNAGQWSIDLLNLNDANAIAYRAMLSGIITELLETRQDLIETIERADKKIEEIDDADSINALKEQRDLHVVRLSELEERLVFLGSERVSST